MDMYIVLAITLFMMVMFIVGKVPYGVITMTCCALLAITGVMSPTEAFSGLSNSTTLLIAGMLALATAFGKTSAVARVRSHRHHPVPADGPHRLHLDHDPVRRFDGRL